MEILTHLWATDPAETFSFDGEHYSLAEAPARPQPTQAQGIPIIIGGFGKRRTPALAARYASEYNQNFVPVADFAARAEFVRQACTAAGRDPSSLCYSTAQTVCVGTDDASVNARAATIGRRPDELRENALAGTVGEVVDKVGRFADAGAERFYLQVLDEDDLEHLELIASAVVSQF